MREWGTVSVAFQWNIQSSSALWGSWCHSCRNSQKVVNFGKLFLCWFSSNTSQIGGRGGATKHRSEISESSLSTLSPPLCLRCAAVSHRRCQQSAWFAWFTMRNCWRSPGLCLAIIALFITAQHKESKLLALSLSHILDHKRVNRLFALGWYHSMVCRSEFFPGNSYKLGDPIVPKGCMQLPLRRVSHATMQLLDSALAIG